MFMRRKTMKREQHHFFYGLFLLLGIISIVFINFRINQPPPIVPADAPENIFSAERAAVHFPHIASKPNPLGSSENEAVFQYIINHLESKGLSPLTHETIFYDHFRYTQRAAFLKNILLRIPGTESGKAVLIMGHYDSVSDAPGASDNGAAVIAMLEVIRMLEHHPPLKNDLIFLFPDGEEYGLLGAEAFFQQHDWAKNVGMVLNLEAMGTRGQSLMFETGFNNLRVIREFAAAAPYPAGNSLSVELWKRMPNATDFDVFKYREFQGLNFAYIGDSFDYHTPGDNIENTDLRSVQHHGSYLASLVLHFGNITLDFESKQDAVYFNTLGYGFIFYPYSAVPFITVLITILFICITAAGIYNKRLKPLKILSCLISFIILLLIFFAVFSSLFQIISSYYPGSSARLLEYNQTGILAGFALAAAAIASFYFRMLTGGVKLSKLLPSAAAVILLFLLSGQITFIKIAITLAAAAWLFFAHKKPAQMQDVWTGAMAAWTLLMITSTFIVPGASFLFTWPLFFSMIPLVIVVFTKNIENTFIFNVLILLCAVPVLCWLSMVMYLIQLAMGLDFISIVLIIAGLMSGLLVPHLHQMTRVKSVLIPGFLFTAGVFLILSRTAGLDFDEKYRKQNSIVFVSDTDAGGSYWFTWHEKPDEWTKHFLTDQPDTIYRKMIFPVSSENSKVPAKKSDAAALNPSVITVLADKTEDGERMLKLGIIPEKDVSDFYFYINTDNHDAYVRVEELEKHSLRNFRNTDWKMFSWHAPPDDGITISIYTEKDQRINLHLTEERFDLHSVLSAAYPERPAWMMQQGDAVYVVSRHVY
jgi:hypothetical protein